VRDRAGTGEVEAERRLPETRPRGHHDHLPGLEPVGGRVEVGEPRRHTERDAATGGNGVDLVHRGLEELLQRHVVLAGASLRDLVDGRLGAVDDLVDLGPVGAVVAELHDARARLDETPQDGLLGDDLGVVRSVGRGGNRGDQRVEIRRAAETDQLAPALQLGRHSDGVGGLAPAVEIENAVVDRLVGRAVEVVGPENLDHVGDGVLAQQHAAEYRLLGREVLRGLTVERTATLLRTCLARRAHRARSACGTIVSQCHTQRHPQSLSYRTCVRSASQARGDTPVNRSCRRAGVLGPRASRLWGSTDGSKPPCARSWGRDGDGSSTAQESVGSGLWTTWGQLASTRRLRSSPA
jgi:hypothetical protein